MRSNEIAAHGRHATQIVGAEAHDVSLNIKSFPIGPQGGRVHGVPVYSSSGWAVAHPVSLDGRRIVGFSLRSTRVIGAIIGDIVGSIYEFNNIRSKDFPLFSETSMFTDDTVCTVAVADTLLNDRDASATLLHWCRKYSGRGYGNQFMRWINMPWQEPYNSYGNGAAMRVSPAAWLGETLDECLLLSDRVTAVTHNHPEGMKGARATVASIFLARQGWSASSIRSEIETVYGYDMSPSVDLLRETHEYNETCQGCVPPALICALEATSFEDAIRSAVSIGGDSDTIAAIAGGLAEALFGVDSDIRTQAMLRLNDEIRTVIEAFYRRIDSRK